MTNKEKRLLMLLNCAKVHCMTFEPSNITFKNLAQSMRKLGVPVTERQLNDWIVKKRIPAREYKGRNLDGVLRALKRIIQTSLLGERFPRREDLNIYHRNKVNRKLKQKQSMILNRNIS